MHNPNFAKEVISILAQGNLFLTNTALQKVAARIIAHDTTIVTPPVSGSYYDWYYRDRTYHDLFDRYVDDPYINVTVDYSNEELPHASVAFYLIDDLITFNHTWYFSTRQFVENFNAAEKNPRITSHLILCNSGGGQAYYLDIVSNTLKNAIKPKFCQIEESCASAAYYMCANMQLYASTNFDTVGSIGVMLSGLDLIPYFEKMGAKYYEIYADASSQKNYQSRELKTGNERPIIDEVLNPYCDSFVAAMQSARPSLAKLPETEGVFNGKILLGSKALDLQMVDGIQSFDITLLQAVEAGRLRKHIYSFI